MSKVKYRVREYTPKTPNQGTHSWFAEAVINSKIDNKELAKKVAARTGMKAYEVQMAIAAVCDIIQEEVLESNSISLSTEEGVQMMTIYPKVNGSISDSQILAETTAAHEKDSSVPVRSVATEADLTPERLSWVLGATIGIKFSKIFAINKQAQKVKFVATDTAIPNDDEPEGGNTQQPTGGGNTGDNTGGGGGYDGGDSGEGLDQD